MSRGKPNLDAYIAAAKAYNESNPKHVIDISSVDDHTTKRRYTAYLRGLLRRRVNIVDAREGFPRLPIFEAHAQRGRVIS